MKCYLKVIAIKGLLVFGFSESGYCSSPKRSLDNELQKSYALIKGKVVDLVHNLHESRKTEMTLYIYKFPANILIAPFDKVKTEIDENQNFNMKIPLESDRVYIRFEFKGQTSSDSQNVYILEKGDSIDCKLSNNRYEFSGNGSVKFKCLNEIYMHKYKSTEIEREYLKNSNWDEYLNVRSSSIDSIFNLRTKIIDKYSEYLGKDLADIILANCYGLRYLPQFLQLGISISNELEDAFLRSLEFKNIDFTLLGKIDSRSIIDSYNYCDYLLLKLAIDVKRDKKLGFSKSDNFLGLLFAKIKDEYSGLVREKLLVLFFLYYKKRPDSLSFLKEALSIVFKSGHREVLLNLDNTISPGADFYPFELVDSSGEIVKLTKFSGKIVIIDFWFTGCYPCQLLNKAMKPIVQKYIDNSFVKFLSINVDRDKDTWLKSLSTGKYTHDESINLYIGDANKLSEHPLIRTYGLFSYPALFIIKDGKIFSANPPKPTDSLDPSNTTEKFINLLNDALAQLVSDTKNVF